MTVAVIIPAAGSGSRFGGDIPKQFRMLGGKPILQRVVEGFLAPERQLLSGAQSPQCFRAAVRRDVLARAPGDDATDEAGLAARFGYDVRLVPGDAMNFKITRAEDLATAERMLEQWS